MTTQAQDLSGYTTMISDLQRDPEDKYIIGKNSYKLFAIKGATINDPQTICINRCLKGTDQEDLIYNNTDTAYRGVLPKYYIRLIINEPQTPSLAGDLIEFDIANITYKTVFES